MRIQQLKNTINATSSVIAKNPETTIAYVSLLHDIGRIIAEEYNIKGNLVMLGQAAVDIIIKRCVWPKSTNDAARCASLFMTAVAGLLTTTSEGLLWHSAALLIAKNILQSQK